MTKRRGQPTKSHSRASQRGKRVSLFEALRSANRTAHERSNRRSGRRQLKSVRAAIAATDLDDEFEATGLGKRLLRWLFALMLLPFSAVTTWTFLSYFSHATVHQGFWQTPAFWYFTTGALLMLGWFWSGLLQSFFLYLYVLGHELTHVVFVLICRGKVTDFHVSADGGYITTNKTNLLIALSPYFVPFWSVVCGLAFVAVSLATELHPYWHLAFYGTLGLTWSFHMLWTLWMIPRDQPDLKENGTFLSLVIIYLANILVLVGLLCAAESHPLQHARDFAMDWLRNAAVSADVAWRWTNEMIGRLQVSRQF